MLALALLAAVMAVMWIAQSLSLVSAGEPVRCASITPRCREVFRSSIAWLPT